MEKKNVKQTEIIEGLEAVGITVKMKEEGYNLIYVNTQFGIKKIKTTLSLQDWLKEQQMKPKQQTKKKKR